MEKQHIIAQMAGQQKVVADVFTAVFSELAGIGGAPDFVTF